MGQLIQTAHTADGYVANNNASWDICHDAASGIAASIYSWFYVESTWLNGNAKYYIDRGFLSFDTSDIPDGATIISATLTLYHESFTGYNGVTSGLLYLVNSTQASGTALANGDYDALGTTQGNSTAIWVGAAYYGSNAYVLNSTGLSWISKTGYTTLALRTNYDKNDSSPGTGVSLGFRGSFYSSNNSSNKPTLTVNYNEVPTAPTGLDPTGAEYTFDSTPTLSWTHNDPDGDAQTQRQIIVERNSDSASMWNSTVATSSQSATYAGTALVVGTLYKWKVRTKDAYGWGPFSSYSTFYSDATGRYWVGGTGNWSDTANWSISSGGAGGAPVPTTSDDVTFDANSFDAASQVVTIDSGTAYCKNMDWTGATNSPTIAGSSWIYIYGDFQVIAAMTWSHSGRIYLNAGGAHNLTSNGLSIGGELVFNTAGATWTLQDALTVHGNWIHFVKGTFDTNDQTLTCKGFYSSFTNTRVLDFGASVVYISGTFNCATSTNLTVTAGTSTIYFTGDSKIFYGGGKTYNDVVFSGDNQTITGSNTFADLELTANKQINLTSGTTQTITTLTATGSADNLITIHSTVAGTAATISDTAGTNTCDYLSLKDITAAGGATFNPGDNSVDEGGNTGWKNDWTDAANAYSSNDTYATHTSPNGKLFVKLSKDGGTTWQEIQEVTHTGTEAEKTFGDGATEKWGTNWVGDDVYDANFRVRVYAGASDSFNWVDFHTFAFDGEIGVAKKVTGIRVITEAKWDGTTTSLDHLKVAVYAGDSSMEIGNNALAGDSTNHVPAVYSADAGVWKPLATRDDAVALTLSYYFNNTASDIGGIYYEMRDNETGEAKSTLSTAGLGTGDNQALVNFATISGKPGIDKIEAGLYKVHCHAEKTAGTKPVQIYATLYKRVLAGTETLLGTSEVSELITDEVHLNLHMVLDTSTDLLTTDRLIVKFFANVGSTGSDATVALYQEGTIDCGIALNVSSSAFNNIFVRQDSGGWVNASGTWTYAGTNTHVNSNTTYSCRITVPSNATTYLSVRMKVRFTQSTGGVKHGVITKVAATEISVYLGEDYMIVNEAITDPRFSMAQEPLGFPTDPKKWDVYWTDASSRSQALPVVGTWYNISAMNLEYPIGEWLTSVQGNVGLTESAGTGRSCKCTFSTANNTESDAFWTSYGKARQASSGQIDHAFPFMRQQMVSITTVATTYYLNIATGAFGGTPDAVWFHGDIGETTILAHFALL